MSQCVKLDKKKLHSTKQMNKTFAEKGQNLFNVSEYLQKQKFKEQF